MPPSPHVDPDPAARPRRGRSRPAPSRPRPAARPPRRPRSGRSGRSGSRSIRVGAPPPLARCARPSVAFPPVGGRITGGVPGSSRQFTRKSIDKGTGFQIVCDFVSKWGDGAMPSTSRTTGFSGGAATVGGGLAAVDSAPASRPAGRRREDRLIGPSEATRRLIAQASAAVAHRSRGLDRRARRAAITR